MDRISALRYRPISASISAIAAVTIQSAGKRFGIGRGGLLGFFEPLGFIFILSGTHYMMNGTPIYGDSIFEFYCTGIVPHYTWIWISAHMSPNDLKVKSFGRIRPMDQLIAKSVVEFLFFVAFAIGLVIATWAFGVSRFAMPHSPLVAIAALVTLSLFAFAIGVINVIVSSFIPLWIHIFRVLARSLMVLSGVMFIPDFLPPDFQYWLAWNPILHGVTWFRTAFYDGYPDAILDKSYLLMTTLLALVIGVALERTTRALRDRF